MQITKCKLQIDEADAAAELAKSPAGRAVELQDVLAAWHTATLRLERTHEMLCAEVARLNKELTIKNSELAQEPAGRLRANGGPCRPRSSQQPGAGFAVHESFAEEVV